MCFRQLDLEQMDMEELENFLAQLNYNIIYLYASQGLRYDNLDPDATIANLFYLISHDDIGR